MHGFVHVDGVLRSPHINSYPSFCERRGPGGFWYEMLATKLSKWDPVGETKIQEIFTRV